MLGFQGVLIFWFSEMEKGNHGGDDRYQHQGDFNNAQDIVEGEVTVAGIDFVTVIRSVAIRKKDKFFVSFAISPVQRA